MEEIFGALKDVTLGEVVKTDDKYTRYIFTFADASGSKMSFTLREDGCVVLGGKTYDALGTDTVFEAAGIDPGRGDGGIKNGSVLRSFKCADGA